MNAEQVIETNNYTVKIYDTKIHVELQLMFSLENDLKSRNRCLKPKR